MKGKKRDLTERKKKKMNVKHWVVMVMWFLWTSLLFLSFPSARAKCET